MVSTVAQKFRCIRIREVITTENSQRGVCAAKAFTLIELLVVISVIALLLSILMPSLQKAKEGARRVVCKSQMRQMGLACILYAGDDEKGRFPPGALSAAVGVTGAQDGKYASWITGCTGSLGPATYLKYIDTGKIFYCPSAKGRASYNGDMGWESVYGLTEIEYLWRNPEEIPDRFGLYTPYHYNAAAKYRCTTEGEGLLTVVDSPMEPLMAEFCQQVTEEVGGTIPNHAPLQCNILFLDGHVEWYRDPLLNVYGNDPPLFTYPSWWGLFKNSDYYN